MSMRRLFGQPRFLAATWGTVAISVGAGALILSLVHTILLRPLPYPDPGRLVVVEHSAPGWDLPSLGTISPGLYAAYRATEALGSLGMYQVRPSNVAAGEEPARVVIAATTPSLLRTLGARPEVGRLFLEEDGLPEAEPVALLTHGLWEEAWGSDPDLSGRTVEVAGVPHRVVGVLEEGFIFPGAEPRLLVAHRMDERNAGTGAMSYRAVGRLGPGSTLESVKAELDAAILPAVSSRPGLAPAFVERGRLRTRLRSLTDRELAGVRPLLWVLLGAVGLLVLIAASNLATVYLVRGEHRAVELAVRSALGGSRGDLRRTFLSEGVLLALGGGVLGLLMAWAGVDFLARAQLELPRMSELTMSWVPAAGGIGLALILGLVAGWAPTLPGRADLATTLRSGGGQARPGGWMAGTRGLLVGLQVALALVLLVASGLMLRTGLHLGQVDSGFDADGLVVLDVALAPASYPEPSEALALHRDLRNTLAALPDVDAVGLSMGIPVRNPPSGRAVIVRDWVGAREEPGKIMDTRFVAPGWAEAMGVPVLEGRSFRDRDLGGGSRTMMVSASLGRELWPGEDAVGRQLRLDGTDPDTWYSVVGVVADTRDDGLRAAPTPMLYVPLDTDETEAVNTLTYSVRTQLEPGAVATAVRSLLEGRDPSAPLTPPTTAEDILRDSYGRVTLTLVLLGIAAAASLFLGIVGIFGVVSYWVERRAREMGIRKALGARGVEIQALVLRQGAALLAAGCAIGTGLALVLGRYVESLLFGVRAFDPLTYGGAVSVVLVSALLAAVLPARRAAAADPVETLRRE